MPKNNGLSSLKRNPICKLDISKVKWLSKQHQRLAPTLTGSSKSPCINVWALAKICRKTANSWFRDNELKLSPSMALSVIFLCCPTSSFVNSTPQAIFVMSTDLSVETVQSSVLPGIYIWTYKGQFAWKRHANGRVSVSEITASPPPCISTSPFGETYRRYRKKTNHYTKTKQDICIYHLARWNTNNTAL